MKLLSGSVSRFVILIPLLIALPFFIWIVMSQRQELRKRASYSTEICWNRVISSGGQYQWPDACKGAVEPGTSCAQLLVPLTEDEQRQYTEWVASGSAVIDQCRGVPATQLRINWRTPDVYLYAEDISILADGREFTASQASSLTVHSDPTGPGHMDATTLEVEWQEMDTEMRLFIYFYAETVPGSNPPRRQWGVSSLRTYNGRTPGDWIFYTYRTPLGNIGSPYISPSLTLTSNEEGRAPGELRIKNLQMQAFLQEEELAQAPTPTCVPRPACLYASPPCELSILPGTQLCEPTYCSTNADCPSGYTCRSTPPGGCPTMIIDGVEQQTACAHKPFCYPPVQGTPTPVPTCFPRPACMDANPPCSPTIPLNGTFCPPTTVNSCTNVRDGVACTGMYCPPCAPGMICTQACYQRTGTCQKGQCAFGRIPTTPFPTPRPPTPTPGIIVATNTPTPTPTPAPQTMNFLVKLAGVSDGSAEGAKISVKFQKRDGTVTQLSQPLVLNQISSQAGVYQASVVLNNPMPAGTQFRIIIKGEKHISVKFCRQVGQTAPCGDNEYITASNSLVYGVDLTGIPLPPGDLAQQDGKADAADFEKIMTLMNKSCAGLTAQEKLTGDVDYNGCVNVRDAFLMRQTLQTRYDE